MPDDDQQLDGENLASDEEAPEEEAPVGVDVNAWRERIERVKQFREKRKAMADAKKARMAEKRAVEEGAKTATKAAATGAKTAAAGAEAASGPLGWALLAVQVIADWWFLLKYFFYLLFFIIATVILMIFAMYYMAGHTGIFGTDVVSPGNPSDRAHYQDVLYDLNLAGSKEAKLKLLKDKNAEIISRLEGEKSALNAVLSPDSDTKESIKLIDEMWKHILIIGNLGKSVKNDDQSKMNNDQKKDIDKKNKEIIKQIDEEYDKWLPLWERFQKVWPGFKEPKLMKQYVAFLNQKGISATEPGLDGNYEADRDGGARQHRGYDIGQPDGSKVLSGWTGKVTHIDYWDYSGWRDYCVYVQHKDYEIGYGHVFPSVKVGDTIGVGQPVGVVANGSGHADIKVKKGGQYWDWGKYPIE